MQTKQNALLSENWIGGVFIKDEGGYKIVLKALQHYKKRLRSISKSPEVKDSGAMFGSILEQEAMKVYPKIEQAITKIHDCLTGSTSMESLKDDVSLLEKALYCYQSDIKKAQDTGHEYYLGLVGDLPAVRNDINTAKEAVSKIKQYD